MNPNKSFSQNFSENTLPREKLPAGVGIYENSNGRQTLFRVRLGPKFLGPGRIKKKNFAKREAALEWIKEMSGGTAIEEAKKLQVGVDQIHDIKVALQILAGRASLVEAANAWEKYVAQAGESKTVEDAIAALHTDQTGQGLSARHVRECKAKLTRFFLGLEKVKVCDLKSEDLEKARDAMDAMGNSPSPEQRAKRIRYASLFMEFCISKKWIKPAGNPLIGVSSPRLKSKKISCLSVEEVALLLLAAKEHHPEALPFLGIKIFAGPRNEELYPLTWEAFKASTIRLEKTKTDRARSVTIEDALRGWITIPEDKTGLILSALPQIKDREAVWLDAIAKIEKKAGVTIPQNGLRHTYGSYHFGRSKDAAATSSQMGNSPRMVLDRYADAVDDDDAALFWSLTPATAKSLHKTGKTKNETLEPRRRDGFIE